MPGFNRRTNCSRRPSGWTFRHAISMIRSARAFVPVVSVSYTTSGRSSGSSLSSIWVESYKKAATISAAPRRRPLVVLREQEEEELAHPREEPAFLPLGLRQDVAAAEV